MVIITSSGKCRRLLQNPEEIQNLETVTERYEKLIEKLEIGNKYKIKELKELKTTTTTKKTGRTRKSKNK